MKREVTIVYTVEDEEAFQRAGNPLRFEHHGLKAHTVAVGDSHAAYTEFATSLQQIADTQDPSHAKAALKAHQYRIRRALQ